MLTAPLGDWHEWYCKVLWSPMSLNSYVRPWNVWSSGVVFYQYADGTLLYSPWNKPSTAAISVRARCLDVVVQWLRENNLNLNPGKTELDGQLFAMGLVIFQSIECTFSLEVLSDLGERGKYDSPKCCPFRLYSEFGSPTGIHTFYLRNKLVQ